MTENLFRWSNQTWLLIDQAGILLGLLTGVITLSAFLYGVLNYKKLRRWLTRNRFPTIGGEITEQDWAGLVFTLSKPETPRWVVEQCQPQRIGLVVSAQSYPVAKTLQADWEAQGIKTYIQEIADADDPAATRTATARLLALLKQYSLAPLAVDVTGGKLTMSLGAFMAAEEHAAASIYVSTEFDTALKKPDLRTARILRVSAAR